MSFTIICWQYPKAIRLVASGLINVKPLVTHRFALEDACRCLPCRWPTHPRRYQDSDSKIKGIKGSQLYDLCILQKLFRVFLVKLYGVPKN